MKGKLFLLLGIGFVPLALTAQSVPYLYNKGVMSVKTGDNKKTALYIGGDFVSEGTTAATGIMYLESAQIVLTGDLYRRGTSATAAHVFDVTKMKNGANNVPAVDAIRSKLIFRNENKAQNVWNAKPSSAGTFNKLDFYEKGRNAIYFPDIVIENKNHVTIHPEIGASVYNITPKIGRLILESRKLTAADQLPTGGSTIHSATNSSVLAHLKVEGKQDMSELTKAEDGKKPLNEYPGVQVNLALTGIYEDGRTEKSRYFGDPIVGMGSPFKAIRADYFMYNFLFTPFGNTIFNEDRNTTIDPQLELQAGQGFVVGIDLRGASAPAYTDIHPSYRDYSKGYKIDFLRRVINKYNFNRFAYGVNPNNLYQVSKNYTSDTPTNKEEKLVNVKPSGSSAYTKEVLSGTNDIVQRTLVKGFNYLSNPFTCPLDISDLVFGPNDGLTEAPGWGIKPGFTDKNVSTAVGQIANRVWVLAPESAASGTYNIWNGGIGDNPGNKWMEARFKYKLIAHIGGTANNEYDNGSGTVPSTVNPAALIAPLQMFVVYANTPGVNAKITIPASARVIDDNALFLRSAGSSKFESDDFLFEVKDLDNGSTDRAAIVLRTFSDINKKGYKDIKKLTMDVSSKDEGGKTKSSTLEGVVKTAGMSALYTKDSDGNAIESKFLAMDMNAPTTSTILYLLPSVTKHDITLRSFRNYTKDKITEVLLEDLKTKKTIKLSNGDVYKTSSSPNDDPARFKVTFRYSPVGGIGDNGGLNPDESNAIMAYYKDNTLTVSGFNDSDYGSQVSVYDIQGRLIKQQKVDGTTVVFNDGFNVGAYIVKVTGNRSYATKFLAR